MPLFRTVQRSEASLMILEAERLAQTQKTGYP